MQVPILSAFITQPLEQAVIQAITSTMLTSSSVLGSSTITVNMKLNTDPNAALFTLAKTNFRRFQLPKEAEDPTVTMSTGSTTAVILTLALPVMSSYQAKLPIIYNQPAAIYGKWCI